MLGEGDLQELLADAVAGRAAVGAAAAVFDGDRTSEGAVGITSALSRIPVSIGTVFRLESLTKLITTTLILQARDVGLIGLDGPVADHLELERPGALAGVTIRHLLSHQSGLPEVPLELHARLDQSIQAAARQVAGLEPLFAPGENLSYSGAGFVVLGAVVEHATGVSWESAVREGVLKPLGMTRSCAVADEALAHRTAVGHLVRGAGAAPEVVTDPVPRGLTATAGMFAGAGDLLRLASVYAEGNDAGRPLVISARSRADATRGERSLESGFAPRIAQGLGWQIADWSGRRLLMHHAFGRGTSGHVSIDAESGVGFAVLANSDTGESVCIDVSRRLQRELLGVVPPAFPEHEPPGEWDRSAFAGVYVHDPARRFAVETGEDDGLVLRVSNTHQLSPEEEVAFPIRRVDGVRFARGAGYVLFGDFDAAGTAHALHVENQLARRTTAARR